MDLAHKTTQPTGNHDDDVDAAAWNIAAIYITHQRKLFRTANFWWILLYMFTQRLILLNSIILMVTALFLPARYQCPGGTASFIFACFVLHLCARGYMQDSAERTGGHLNPGFQEVDWVP